MIFIPAVYFRFAGFTLVPTWKPQHAETIIRAGIVSIPWFFWWQKVLFMRRNYPLLSGFQQATSASQKRRVDEELPPW